MSERVIIESLAISKWFEIYDWCTKTMGPPGSPFVNDDSFWWVLYGPLPTDTVMFSFKNIEDSTLFKLKWL